MIGVFDSGVGGLTILKYFLRDLPGYNYIYLGDNARAPYGSRSQDIIYQYTEEAVDFLFSKGCKLIIIACNTASAQALRKIQQGYLMEKYPDRKVVGVIRPLVESINSYNFKKIGVLGTRATVESEAYLKEFIKLNSELEVIQQGAPLLVPLIEEGWLEKRETKMILQKYLKIFKNTKVEGLLLACTHYPFLLKEITDIMGINCIIPNPGEVISRSLIDYLKRHNELNILINNNPQISFFTTGDRDNFKKLSEDFLGMEIGDIVKVCLK